MNLDSQPLLLRLLQGKPTPRPPIWLMRQAGRYLPEYRQLREKAGGFLDLCYNPKLACEVTLQPIRRFGFDAAILFSDILVVPHALGQPVWFEPGEGPKLTPIEDLALLEFDEDRFLDRLSPVLETVSLIRSTLDPETALIGFCGAPWTVATYMIQGGGSKDQQKAREFIYQQPEAFDRLMELLVRASVVYLSKQVEAGAEVLQLFESWASGLTPGLFDRAVLRPTQAIVTALKQRHPQVPIIGFPRAVAQHLYAYAGLDGLDGIGIDWSQDLTMAWQSTGSLVTQGNLDPALLIGDHPHLDMAIDSLLQQIRGRRHIVNLGHGITPNANIDSVSKLVRRVKGE